MPVFKDFWIAVGKPGAYSKNMEYSEVFGMKERFGIMIQHNPYSPKPKVKNIIEQNWKDEEGVDAWIPMTASGAPAITHEALEYKPKFVIWGNAEAINSNQMIRQMLEAIEGRWLKIWDEYSQMGFDGVYLTSIGDDLRFKRRNYDFVEFELTFKVNGTNLEAPFEGITQKRQ